MAGKIRKIQHNHLENCANKLLVTVDLLTVYARCIQQVAVKIADLPECREWLREPDWGVVLLLDADVVPTMSLDLYRILGVCHECESIIPYCFSPELQLLHVTLAYLIENGNIEGRRVRIPGEDEVIEALERHDILLEFYAECPQCGTDNYSYLDEDGAYLEGMKAPKLTI